MKRFILQQLEQWKNSTRRKPLVLRGARQVGKTWVLKEFGKSFPEGFVYFNFDKEEEFKQFFSGTKDVKRILRNLAMARGQKITPRTLIIFDEIQACEEALNTLKYFCEDAPEYYVACAGSLLGLQLTQGFPVGKVNFLNMGPMTFTEFLLANGDANLVEFMHSVDSFENIPDAFFNPLSEKLKMYFVVGGMPEAVRVWVEEGDVKAVEQVQFEILDSYESDFGKHTPIADVPKIHLIWDSLPSQLARENKKFMYNVVKNGARAREYENALNWLKNANFVDKVFCISKPGLPISAYDNLDAFKVFMVDVGLLRCKSRLVSSAFAEGLRLFTEFKGALTENFVLQSLKRQFDVPLRYWASAPYEVDFILQRENEIIPIEVKASENVKSTSVKKYASLYERDTRRIIRFSMKNLCHDGKILNVPLFMIDELDRLLG
ncbi:MAG: ATP-binding protein [Fibrobacter sp.]|nr:ATP-binding protein [Fibrobacter sp.]